MVGLPHHLPWPNESTLFVQCGEGEFQSCLRKATKTLHKDIQPIAIDNYVKKHLDMHTKHETEIMHRSYARKNKWKHVIHQAPDHFAHNPTNQKDMHWKSNRCWEPEDIGNVIDVPFLPQADDKKHVCDTSDE